MLTAENASSINGVLYIALISSLDQFVRGLAALTAESSGDVSDNGIEGVCIVDDAFDIEDDGE